MRKYVAHILVTLAALTVAAAHLLWPDLKVDAVSATFLLVAILPWLGNVFKKVELPGGLKVEYTDLQKVEKAAEEAGLLPRQLGGETAPEADAVALAREDPNLALVGLRIDIERRLRAIASAKDIAADSMGIGPLLRALEQRQVIGRVETAVLRDIVGTLNNAAHGAKVEPDAAEWALNRGSDLLAALDRIAAKRDSQTA